MKCVVSTFIFLPLDCHNWNVKHFIDFRSRSMLTRRLIKSKLFLSTCFILSIFPVLFLHRDAIGNSSVPYAQSMRPFLQSTFSGNRQCLPRVTPFLIARSVRRKAICHQHSPFAKFHSRVATVTAHFGSSSRYFEGALQTHLLHSLTHSTELRVLCDPIIDDGLWNKPAYILQLLMSEMLKPERQRLEWIMWADRDTMILDLCRPTSSFLPPLPSSSSEHGTYIPANATEIHLLVTNDFNGLNNGVFFLRVSEWSVALFTSILAFRHYEPDVVLPWSEQSAMEHVISSEHFRHQTQFVPQHWFNAYDIGGAKAYATRDNVMDLSDMTVRRGDFLVHFAGSQDKKKVIEEWVGMLGREGDVWEKETVQRDVSEDIVSFWGKLGY